MGGIGRKCEHNVRQNWIQLHSGVFNQTFLWRQKESHYRGNTTAGQEGFRYHIWRVEWRHDSQMAGRCKYTRNPSAMETRDLIAWLPFSGSLTHFS